MIWNEINKNHEYEDDPDENNEIRANDEHNEISMHNLMVIQRRQMNIAKLIRF